MIRLTPHFCVLLGSILAPLSEGALRINEIADKGTSNACDGNDWVEIYNTGPDAVDMSDGYILHDDKGINDKDAFTFPPGSIAANDYLLVCAKMKLEPSSETGRLVGGIELDDPSSPNFGISSTDIITLVHQKTVPSTAENVPDQTVYEIVSSVTLPSTLETSSDVTYAYNETLGEYFYTSTPTPGADNIITRPKTPEELIAEHVEALRAQNELGKAFFGMDERGYKVENAMDEILQLHLTMDAVDYDYMMANRTFELYRPFQSARVTTVDGEELLQLNSQGEIRPKGQSTLAMSICVGTKTMPFQIDFAAFNETQSLFGANKIYLRNHMGDYSYSRDYMYNRMLARFGLPHLRTRKVEFYINGEKFGFYSLMEAADQEYVFARSFPDYDPTNFALYKIKSFANWCGNYSHAELEEAKTRVNEISTPPYAFERGEHRTPMPEFGLLKAKQCLATFIDMIHNVTYKEVAVAYERYDESCADMLLGEELIDRDLGSKKWDDAMRYFIENDFRRDKKCSKGCVNSDLAKHSDIDNMLKSFAFYAVLVISDSPLINGNNYYLAQSGEEAFGDTGGWKIMAYDFNVGRIVYCRGGVCDKRLVHWSIARPTCTSLEDNPVVGPLLSDPTLHAKYLEYVREFTETIAANETFIQEMVDHQAAQDQYVRADTWSFYGSRYDKELTPESASWEEEGDTFPLLPTLKARVEDIRAQLAAIDAGTFPRGPHVGAEGDNEAWEYCPDWRAEEANRTRCEQACRYEGCDVPGMTVESFCHEEQEYCLHGDADEKCRGVQDGTGYPGMEPSENGMPTYCLFAAGVPVKAAQCAPPSAQTSDSLTSSAACFSGGKWIALTMLALGSLHFL